MTVNSHRLNAPPTCASGGCGVWAEFDVVVEASDPGQLTATLPLCRDHASSVVANSDEARELLFDAQEALAAFAARSASDTPGDGELWNRIRSYLDLD